MSERLHKVLAHAGCGSRRDCEELIAQGRVAVDGRTVTELGTQVEPRRQTIKVDGKAIKIAPLAYFLLNKPRGVVCSAADDARESRAIDFSPKGAGRLHTVGRLDKESEGLIILTNDGELTDRLTHPRHDFPKTYHVAVRGQVHAETLAKLRKGVWLAEGKATVSLVRVLRSAPQATQLEVELREGKNREIRRILARVGHPVKELRRVAIGPIKVGGLGVGKVRPLTEAELEVLREATSAGRKIDAETRRRGGEKADASAPPRLRASASSKRPAPKARKPERPATPRPEVEETYADPVFPAEPPPAARPRYVPDEDGVIVVRRPPVRSFEEE